LKKLYDSLMLYHWATPARALDIAWKCRRGPERCERWGWKWGNNGNATTFAHRRLGCECNQ